MIASTTSRKDRPVLYKVLRAAGSAAFWLAVWYGCARAVGQELLLPSPTAVISALGGLAASGEFWASAGVSLARIFAGYLAGVAGGVLLAGLTCASKTADTLLSPAIRVIRATPVASFIILCLLWLSYTTVPAFIAMLMVLPVVWANVCAGVAQTDANLLELARATRMSGVRRVRYLYIPAALGPFRAACVTALGLAWKSGIAAEVLCLPKRSIGAGLYYSKIYLETPDLFAWTITVIILSFLIEKGLVLLFSRIGRGENGGAAE